MKKIILLLNCLSFSGFLFSQDCSKIVRTVDDFTGKITINTPTNDYGGVYKVIKGDTTTYYLRLKTIGETLSYEGEGVIVLFEDGSKWQSPYKIYTKAATEGWNYNTMIPMTDDDLKEFSTKPINKFRLYIYDRDIDESEGESLRAHIECLLLAK